MNYIWRYVVKMEFVPLINLIEYDIYTRKEVELGMRFMSHVQHDVSSKETTWSTYLDTLFEVETSRTMDALNWHELYVYWEQWDVARRLLLSMLIHTIESCASGRLLVMLKIQRIINVANKIYPKRVTRNCKPNTRFYVK